MTRSFIHSIFFFGGRLGVLSFKFYEGSKTSVKTLYRCRVMSHESLFHAWQAMFSWLPVLWQVFCWASFHSRSPTKMLGKKFGVYCNWKHQPCALLKDRHPFIKKRGCLLPHKKSSTLFGTDCRFFSSKQRTVNGEVAARTASTAPGHSLATKCAASWSPFNASMLVALQSTPNMPWWALAPRSQSASLWTQMHHFP